MVDLGCGEGALLRELIADASFTRVLGVDVSHRALEKAAARLGLDRLPDTVRARLELIQSSATYRDDRLAGFDAVVLMEVIEHVDLARLPALERSVFARAHADHGHRDHPQCRAQRALPVPGCGGDAAPRPPVRVDPGRVRRLGRADRRRVRVLRAVSACGR